MCVYVDTAFVGVGFSFPPAPEVPLPAAIVRAEVPLDRWREVIHGLLPEKKTPRVNVPWTVPGGVERTAGLVDALRAALDVEFDAPIDLELDWVFHARIAERSGPAPVLSNNRARFGRDACVVVAPDHGRLGRLAADAARRLRAGEGRVEPLRLSLRSAEVWVDLDALDRAGLSPPLPFLASADRLRRAGSATPGPGGAGR
jgi:hypothetical protein